MFSNTLYMSTNMRMFLREKLNAAHSSWQRFHVDLPSGVRDKRAARLFETKTQFMLKMDLFHPNTSAENFWLSSKARKKIKAWKKKLF